MRILFLGDVVGSPGMKLVQRAIPFLRKHERLDVVIANVENAAGGSGLTSKLFHRLRTAQVDLMTMGDHIYRKAEIIPTLNAQTCICKPANYPADAPGRDYALCTRSEPPVAVISLQGRTYMRPVDCPFQAVDRVLDSIQNKAGVILVDMHAEATADKYLMAHHLNGRVAAVIGTHTHVQTADEQILDGGTAFLCDAGMTGPHNGVLGRKIECVLPTTVTFVPRTWDLASGDVRMNGAILEVEDGRALSIERFTMSDDELKKLTEATKKEPPAPVM